MRFELFLGLRYLWNTRRTRFLSLISLISVLGIAIGVAALITVQSVMDGFQNQIKNGILGSKPHIIIEKKKGIITNYSSLIKKLKKIEGVAGVTPAISNEIMVSNKSYMLGGFAVGIDLKTVGSVINLPSQVVSGDISCLSHSDKTGCRDLTTERKSDGTKVKNSRLVFIGKEMADYFKIGIGDKISIISPVGGGMGPTGPIPLSKHFTVAGTFVTGMYEYDLGLVYMPLSTAQEFFSLKGGVKSINIKINNPYKAKEIVSGVQKTLASDAFRIRDWMDMNRNIFSALKMEKIVMFIILGFIILVASFNIVSTLFMMIIGKIREISILKAVGSSNDSVMKIFIINGVIIGSAGTSIGMVLGYIACSVIGSLELKFAQDVYYMSKIPVEFSFATFFLVGLSALLITFVATLIPSRMASKISPAEGLRYD